jgi:serine/threonine protein phosphatase PrpC
MSGMNPRNNYSSDESDDNFSLSPPTTNGCSAILALIVNDRLFVANIGNSTAILCKQLSSDRTDENYLFQLSALHEDSEKTTDINSLPNRCFGGPASKNEAYCEPFVVSQGIQVE